MSGWIGSPGIRTKILAGFGVVLVILLAVSVMALREFDFTRAQMETYAQRVEVVGIARQLDRDAVDLRRFAREYALTQKEQDAVRTIEIASSIRQQIVVALDRIKNPERLARMSDLADQFEAYMKNFDTIHRQGQQEASLIAQAMDPAGGQFYEKVVALRDAADLEGEPGITAAAVSALEHGILARLYANQMIGRHDATFGDKARHEFEVLGVVLKRLDDIVPDGPIAVPLRAIEALIPEYAGAFSLVSDLAESNQNLVDTVNAAIAVKLAEDAAFVRDSGIADETRSKPIRFRSSASRAVEPDARRGRVWSGWDARLADRFGDRASGRGMTAAMQRLAGGDTSVEIPAKGRRDEIGQMAKAMDVFKEQIVTAERMRAEQEAQKQRSAEERRLALRKMADISRPRWAPWWMA